jgi:RimJ/RimL family protein N-acetyltransferase
VRGGRLRIESLAKRHLKDVARLHVMGLTREFSGWAGRSIMGLFYRELMMTREPPPGFVALLNDRVVGFAVAVEDAAAIKRRVAVRWGWWLAVLGVVQLVTRPQALMQRFWRRLNQSPVRLAAGQRDALEVYCPPPRIEFRGIVVDPRAHLPGVALALMRARLAWAKAAGYKSIYFQIEPDNEHSIKLCQWAGAEPVPEDVPQERLRFYKVLV